MTIIFCDLVGSTALSQRFDPEELREILLSYRTVCAEVVQRFGGYIAQYFGDGVMIYFGYPTAHDDDAVMAVRAALDIIRAVRQTRLSILVASGLELRVHVGVHTGLVVTGELGDDPRTPVDFIGETPNLAARLEQQAEADTVLISRATYLLVKDHFECQPIDEFTITGLMLPLHAFRVLGEQGVPRRPYVLKTWDLTQQIGRDNELALLSGQWKQAQEGLGRGVMISGDPGIGKSRLVRALREQLANEPHIFLGCYCSPRTSNSAFFPIIDLLERQLGFDTDDTPQQRLKKLEKGLLSSGLALAEVPLLTFLLSVSLCDRHVAPELSPHAQREKTIEVLLAWLKAKADERPILIVFEDLHWADASTLDLLTRLIGEIQRAKVLLLLTFRPEFQSPWDMPSNFARVKLQRLSPAQASTMLDVVTSGNALPPAVHDQILEKTDGVPLFIEETAKMVIEAGGSTFEKFRSPFENEQKEAAKPAVIASIPATLRDSLMARLDRLGRAKATAELVSMLGRDFSYDLVRAVASIPALELDRDLATLIKAELLYQQAPPPRAMYRFKHSLIQEVAYEALSLGSRRRYHRHVATIMAEQFPESRPEIIADHYTLAGSASEAIKYWRLAGQYALERSANVEAAAHLSRALDLIERLPGSAQRDQEEATLQIALGAALAATNGYANLAVADAYGRARELCEGLGATPETFSALRGLEAFYQVRGPVGTARRVGEQLLRLAEQSHDKLVIAEAMRPLGWCFFCMGEVRNADCMLATALDLFDQAGLEVGTHTFGIYTGVMGLANSAWVRCYLGDPAEAMGRSGEAVRRARKASHAQSLAYALCMKAAVHQSLGDAVATQRLAEQAITVARENAYSYWLAWATILQGWAIAEQGCAASGMETLRGGLAAYRSTGAELFRPYSLGLLANVCGQAGLIEEALASIDEALDSSHENDVPFYDAELYRLRGDLLARISAPEMMVERSLARAVEIARCQGCLLLELRAQISLWRLHSDTARGINVRHRLAEILGCFAGDFEFPDLRQGRAIVRGGSCTAA